MKEPTDQLALLDLDSPLFPRKENDSNLATYILLERSCATVEIRDAILEKMRQFEGESTTNPQRQELLDELKRLWQQVKITNQEGLLAEMRGEYFKKAPEVIKAFLDASGKETSMKKLLEIHRRQQAGLALAGFRRALFEKFGDDGYYQRFLQRLLTRKTHLELVRTSDSGSAKEGNETQEE